jgi:hypothetical protein
LLFPTMQADDAAGRVALFFYGATNDPNVPHSGTDVGSTTTPFLMDRRSPASTILPGVWTEPVPCGDTFASVDLLMCTVDSDCPQLFFGGGGPGKCTGGRCVGTRLLGDYEGMAFIPGGSGPGDEGSGADQWNPVWTTEPTGVAGVPNTLGPHIHTSFDQANQ